MNAAQEIALVRLAQTSVGKPFVWGQMDCNTLGTCAVDIMLGTSYSQQIIGKYSTLREALEFQKSFLHWDDELTRLGAEIVPNAAKAQSGDLIIVPLMAYDAVHVCICGKVLSVSPNSFVTLGRASLIPDEATIYRLPVT